MNIGLLWHLYRFKKNTLKSREQIKKLQQQKLKKLLHYVYRNSAYYRNAFQKIGIREEDLDSVPLHSLPVMNKDVLLEHYDEIVTDEAVRQADIKVFSDNTDIKSEKYLGRYHIVHSSGSTGVEKYFLYDDKAWRQMLLGIIRGALWGMHMSDILKLLKEKPRILYVAATEGRYGGAMAVGDGVTDLGASQRCLDINMPMEKWIETVTELKPNIIIGYPSAIKLLAEQMKQRSMQGSFKRIISCGEPLTTSLRKYLEQYFQCMVINFYGASESLALGLEANGTDGMILFDDLNIIEVIDGEMYITCLYNYSQPLIRYHLTDKLKPRPERDGIGFSRADVLLCRNEDAMWFEREDGSREFLHPLSVEGLCVEGLLDYQFVQTTKQTFEIWAELSAEHASGAAKERIERGIQKLINPLLKEKRLTNIIYEIKFTEHILPENSTGKKKLIVRKEGY